MITNISIARVETGGLSFGKPTVTRYAVVVNGAVVTPYVTIHKILVVANIAFESAQAVDFDSAVRWDRDDQTFLTRLYQETESHEARNKNYS